MRTRTKAEEVAARLVAEALSSPEALDRSDAERLRRLLSPRAVRAALRRRCDTVWVTATEIAEAELRDGRFALVAALGDALGITRDDARELCRRYRGGGRGAAQDLVAEVEGVSSRTIRTRLKALARIRQWQATTRRTREFAIRQINRPR